MYSIEFDMLSGNQDIIITKLKDTAEPTEGDLYRPPIKKTLAEVMQFVAEWIEKENARRIEANYSLKNRRYLIHYQG